MKNRELQGRNVEALNRTDKIKGVAGEHWREYFEAKLLRFRNVCKTPKTLEQDINRWTTKNDQK